MTGLTQAFALREAKHVGPQAFVFALRTNPRLSGPEQEAGELPPGWALQPGERARDGQQRAGRRQAEA